MQGHVFYAHYFAWMDTAHLEMWREVVGPYEEFVGAGFEFVVAEASARFHSGARFDEDIEIDTVVEAVSNSSITSRLTVRRGTTPVVEGRLRHVCVDSRTYVKCPWPGEVRQLLDGRARPARS